MRHVRLITLSLAFTLLGCHVPLNLPQTLAPMAQGPNGNRLDGSNPSPDATPRTGAIRIAVYWPERDLPDFSAQVIPIRTRSLTFQIWDADGKPLLDQPEIIRREAGDAIASKMLYLPVGDGYKAEVKAYAEVNPTADSEAIAVADASGFSVRWGETTAVPLELTAQHAPRIALSLGYGTPQQTLTITGRNLDLGADAPVVVFPSGREVAGNRKFNPAHDPTDLLDDTLIEVEIPSGAGSGLLEVRVDGVGSTPLTTTSTAIFREIQRLELRAQGEEAGGIHDGNGAIASWLGETFTVGVVGRVAGEGTRVGPVNDQVEIVPVNDPLLTRWEHSSDVGSLPATRSYQASKLGTDVISARVGSVESTRSVLVAPPAGPIIRPAGETRGIVDHSLTRIPSDGGDRFLVTWFQPDDSELHWRMFNADGTPAGIERSTPAAWNGFERVARVSASDTEICLVYRRFQSNRNALLFTPLSLTDGSPLRVYPVGHEFAGQRIDSLIPGDGLISDHLNVVASDGFSHLIGFTRFDGMRYNHLVSWVKFDGANPPAGRTVAYPADITVPYSFRDDVMDISAIPEQYVIARHVATSDGSGPTGLQIDQVDSVTLEAAHVSASLHERNRVAAVASNGPVTLAASMEPSATGMALKIYRYLFDMTLEDLTATIPDLQIANADPLNWPIELAWDGTQFTTTYARMVGSISGGMVRNHPQAMVQAVAPDGNLIGPAYSLARESQVPAFVPTDEGGMALWLDSNRSLVMRRVKYR
jgi:hypothetical protein